MRTDLLERGFKFEIIKQRKLAVESFTPKEHETSVEMALGCIPRSVQITEVVIETLVDDRRVGEKGEKIQMQTVIYWKGEAL